MGLDMYLYKKNILAEGEEKVGYWRKANHIHKWFVDNCEGGIDSNGNESPVTFKQLKDLKKLCNIVLKDHSRAEELLPRQEGFFFGETSYNDYYFECLRETKKIINKIMKEGEYSGLYYYQSSW